MSKVIIFLVFLFILVGGIIYLQIFLSKTNNRFLGLIFPIICLIFSLSIILFTALGMATTVKQSETVEGIVVSEKIYVYQPEKPSFLALGEFSLSVF